GKNNWNDENDLRFPIISLDFVEEKYTDPYSHSVVFDTREIVTSEILRKCIQDKRNVNKESIVIHTHVFDPAFATNLFDSFLVEAINSSKQFYRIHIIAHSVEYDLPVDHIEGENDKHLVDHITEVFKKDLKDDRVLLIELPRGIVIHKSNLNPEIQVFDYHKVVVEDMAGEFPFESKLQDSKQFGLDLLYRGMISKNIAASFQLNINQNTVMICVQYLTFAICAFPIVYDWERLLYYAAQYGDVLVLRELVRHPNYPDYKDGSLNPIIEIAIMSLHDSPEIIAGLLKLPVRDPQPKGMEEFIKEYKISSWISDSEKEKMLEKQELSLIAFGKMKNFIKEYKISSWIFDREKKEFLEKQWQSLIAFGEMEKHKFIERRVIANLCGLQHNHPDIPDKIDEFRDYVIDFIWDCMNSKWGLIDLAVEHDKPEIVKYLLSFGADHFCNPYLDDDISMGIILFGKNYESKISKPSKKKKLAYLSDLYKYICEVICGETPLARALTRIFREKEESEYSETPAARTLSRQKSIECAKLLVSVKHEWPVGLELCDCHETITDPIEECTKLMKSGDIIEIEKRIKSKEILPTWRSLENRSALYVALQAKQYDLYAILKSHGFLRHEPYDLEEKKAENIQMALHKRARLSQPPDEYIYSKTVIVQKDKKHRDDVKKAYHELNKIEWIQMIFKVLRAADGPSMIVVDFDKDVAEISGEKNKQHSLGTAYYGDSIDPVYPVMIAGQATIDPYPTKIRIDSVKNMRGTIAHELTHIAMQCIYKNEMFPFRSGESTPEVEKLKDAIWEAEEKYEDTIIGAVFGYKENDWPAEIIVRVPQILAVYGQSLGEKIIKKEAPLLYEWYRDFVVEECKNWLKEDHKDEFEFVYSAGNQSFA
ncbi:hypothetical protein ADUPG1_011293, partial [Aduncisulcus paluster]